MAFAVKKTDRRVDVGWMDDAVRLVWMGLDGRNDDFARYLRRCLPVWREQQPELAERVASMLEQHRGQPQGWSRGMGVRESAAPGWGSGTSTGGEELIRLESPVGLPVEPVWSAGVGTELDSLVRERAMADKLAEAGLSPTHTVIFTGPPGVGKTLAARWLARELNLPLAVLNLSTVMSSFLGRTGANLREVIRYGSQQPCVLLLDELDAIAKRRDDPSDIGELKRLVTVLLQELDTWPREGLLVAATNHEQLIDPAVWRRFEQRISFPLPDADAQARLLDSLLGEPWRELPTKTRGALSLAAHHMSPADLTLLTQRARREQILHGGALATRLESLLGSAIASLPLAERRRVGAELSKFGMGQRAIHRLTGLARETIRSDGEKPREKGPKNA